MSLNRKKLRNLILEEIERISEMEEFAESKSGKAFTKEGDRIKGSAKKIYEISSGHTGSARRTLQEIAQFVHKVGEGISGINDLSEGNTESKMPTVKEYKSMLKAISKMES
jgi:hypothetical protein